MKPALRHIVVCALLLVVGIGAQAQGDEVLERYGLALANLSESLLALSSDSTASRDELDRAAGALRFMAASAGSPNLVEAMERVFERARSAIQNRSVTDLGVQTSLLGGGFQRALFDSALALLEDEPATALTRLDRLATDLDFDDQTRAALAEAGTDAAAIRREFEAAVAERVGQQLELAEERYAQSRDSAYRTLADAYGDFLLIQDSPRADARLNAAFAAAAEELIADRGEEMSARLQSLAQGFDRLADAARSTVPESDGAAGTNGTTPGDAVDPASGSTTGDGDIPRQAAVGVQDDAARNTAEGAGQDAGQDAVTDVPRPAAERTVAGTPTGANQGEDAGGETAPSDTAANEVARNDVARDDGAAAAAIQTGAAPAGAVNAGQQATGDSPPSDTGAETGAEAGAVGVTDSTDMNSGVTNSADTTALRRALARELILAGVPATQVERLAEDLQERGLVSLGDLSDELYTSAGRLVADIQAGDTASAESRLSELSAGYASSVRPLVAILSPAIDRRTTQLMEKLAASSVLRTQDALVLIGQIEAVDRLLAGSTPVRTQIVNSETTIVWTGWLRLVTLLTLALLAVIPLFLLNLAFGGGNRNWQLIGVALFLLLLPVIYEGLASLASLAAELLALPVLSAGTTFSMFESPIGQVAWAAVTAAGILFASAGLYGICVQFGLLGGRQSRTGDSQTMISAAPGGDADTVVDWDEEF